MKTKKLELITKPTKADWTSIGVSIVTSFASCVIAVVCVSKIVNQQAQKQTQVVIDPRDGDIIVKDGDDYKLLQLVEKDDIVLPTKIQEIQLKAKDSDASKRVDVNNQNGEDWSNRDSFKYVINNVHINTNKLFNLIGTIQNIDIYCDFYLEKNITSLWSSGDRVFKKNLFTSKSNEVISEHNNIESDYEYVTKEINDGFEWCKIRIELKYKLEETIVTDTISTDWIATTQDFIV